jgi:hypothetical protein
MRTRTVGMRLLSWLGSCALVAGSCALAGCSGEPSGLNVAAVDIENDAQIAVEPGFGAGLYVEYYTGGDWYVFTTCDTLQSDYGCQFEISLYVPRDQDIWNTAGDDLEFTEDELFTERSAVHLNLWTFDDFDGVSFSTDPGTTVRLDFSLDGYIQPEVLFWNGNGRLRDGAPSIPLDLEPEAP